MVHVFEWLWVGGGVGPLISKRLKKKKKGKLTNKNDDTMEIY